jgi:hypothetical protein
MTPDMMKALVIAIVFMITLAVCIRMTYMLGRASAFDDMYKRNEQIRTKTIDLHDYDKARRN